MHIFLRKRNVLIVFTLVCSLVAFIVCANALGTVSVKSSDEYKVKIVLDAGHGGIDGGVSGVNTNVKESDLNLKIVKALKRQLENAGMQAVLTRENEDGLYGNAAYGSLKRKDMERRRDIINEAKPDLVVSIHLNKFSSSSRRGAQVFYKKGSEKGKMLADCIQNSFNSMEEATRSYSALTGDYYILNCTEYPSVIAECGFLSNPEDEKLLLTEEYREKVAYAVFKGIVNYFSENAFAYF